MGAQYYLLSAVVGAAAVVVAIMFVTHPRTIRTYCDRACTGRAWKRAFPRASKAEIRSATQFYYAEEYHQQYLAKNPNGYCGIGGCGVPFKLAELQAGE